MQAQAASGKGSAQSSPLQETREAEANYEPNHEPTGKKRKRKTLACYDCRRRKLKCDRIYPACGRCVRAGQAHQCHYESLPETAPDGSSASDGECVMSNDPIKDTLRTWVPTGVGQNTLRPPATDATMSLTAMLRAGKFEALEERIARLEAMSKTSNPDAARLNVSSRVASPYTPPGSALAVTDSAKELQNQSEVEMMFFKGRSFHTQFHGASNPTSMLSQFPELRAFMKAAIRQYSSLAKIQSDLKLLNQNLKIEAPVYKNSLDAELLTLVPERSVADHLVNLYMQNVESIYRILHVPTFSTEYNHFWESPQDSRPCFVAILLLVMASMCSLASDAPKTFIGRSSTARETSVRWVQTVEDWMNTQSRKHVSVENYQIWLLMIIAKHMNIIKKKRGWEMAGSVIKIFMGAGMHREPSILGRKITFFDQEMRRRIWATAVEWDLQASLARGMPSSVAACPSDCAAPMNIDDKTFDETTLSAPRSRPISELSDSSFLHVASQSLRLRISLASLVNDPGARVDYDEVLRWEERIKQQLDAIPSWEDEEHKDSQHRPSNLLASILLDVQLRQYIIWLHFPYASRNGSDSQNNYSRTACFNNACMIIDLHSKAMERDKFALCLLRSDGYLAALTICHNVFASSLHRNNIIFQTLITSFNPVIERALKMQEEKIMRLGEGRNHYWFISAAASFVQAKISPETATASKQQAVDRVTRLFYRILTGQEDYGSNGHPKTPPVDSGAQLPLETVVPANPKDLELQQQHFNPIGADFDPFQHLDPAEWALDNLWIDNIDWTQI